MFIERKVMKTICSTSMKKKTYICFIKSKVTFYSWIFDRFSFRFIYYYYFHISFILLFYFYFGLILKSSTCGLILKYVNKIFIIWEHKKKEEKHDFFISITHNTKTKTKIKCNDFNKVRNSPFGWYFCLILLYFLFK